VRRRVAPRPVRAEPRTRLPPAPRNGERAGRAARRRVAGADAGGPAGVKRRSQGGQGGQGGHVSPNCHFRIFVGWVKRRFAAPTHHKPGRSEVLSWLAVGRRGEAPLDPPYFFGTCCGLAKYATRSRTSASVSA